MAKKKVKPKSKPKLKRKAAVKKKKTVRRKVSKPVPAAAVVGSTVDRVEDDSGQ